MSDESGATEPKKHAVYTRTGDAGYTGIVSGTRLRKDHAIIEANGVIDELSSCVGLVLALLKEQQDTYPSFNQRIEHLQWMQSGLFGVSGMIASIELADAKPLVSEEDVKKLESWVDEMQQELPALKNFILPGGSVLVSHIHIARATCRRAERACVTITVDPNWDHQSAQLPPVVIPFLNRMSDYLFVMARWITRECGQEDQLWTGR